MRNNYSNVQRETAKKKTNGQFKNNNKLQQKTLNIFTGQLLKSFLTKQHEKYLGINRFYKFIKYEKILL